MTTTFQRLRKEIPDKFLLAEMYYSLLSTLNGLALTMREVQLVAFTCIRGNISYGEFRDEFCKKHNTSAPTINNMISRLKKLGVLIKDGGKIKVNPHIVLNFDNDIKLDITLYHGEAGKPVS